MSRFANALAVACLLAFPALADDILTPAGDTPEDIAIRAVIVAKTNELIFKNCPSAAQTFKNRDTIVLPAEIWPVKGIFKVKILSQVITLRKEVPATKVNYTANHFAVIDYLDAHNNDIAVYEASSEDCTALMPRTELNRANP